MSDNEPREYPPGTVYLEIAARALHEQVERIATGERDHISERLLWVGVAVLVAAAVAGVVGLYSAAAALTGGSVALILASLYLRCTRPAAVKPWGAER